jgi:hypothetical protein
MWRTLQGAVLEIKQKLRSPNSEVVMDMVIKRKRFKGLMMSARIIRNKRICRTDGSGGG